MCSTYLESKYEHVIVKVNFTIFDSYCFASFMK